MKKEYLDIVDEKGDIIGKDTRESLHSSPDKIHQTVNVLIVNSKGEVLVQQRSLQKKFGPGIWEISAGGHVESGEMPKEAAIKELKEELGVNTRLDFIDKKIFKFENESELAHLYFGKSDGPFELDKGEIERIVFMRFNKLKAFLKRNREKSMLERWFPVILRKRKIIFDTE